MSLKVISFWIGGLLCAATASLCRADSPFERAEARWNMTGKEVPGHLELNGDAAWGVALEGEDQIQSRRRGGDGLVAVLKDGWFQVSSQENAEPVLSGSRVSVLVRFKIDQLDHSYCLLSKGGNDQSLAYEISLDPAPNGFQIRTLMGSDEIAGAHRLIAALEADQLGVWHDVVLRFDGHKSELFVDGSLRDDEVTDGEIRNWNRHPILIGGKIGDLTQYTLPLTLERVTDRFQGMIDHIVLWNDRLSDEEVMFVSGSKKLEDRRPDYYAELWRPQFHFAAKKNWINDPNGLVFYNGVWHLFFQYMPPHRPGAYKDWGHATSTDLVHWTQDDRHITPHRVWGGCWSGSAVVDTNNTSGFQTGEDKPIIAILTNGGEWTSGLGPACTQCIAVSTDGGKNFAYYDQNPVIRTVNHYMPNRDPKVFWDKERNQWLLSMFLESEGDFILFSSQDLKNWQELSRPKVPGTCECPTMIELPVDAGQSPAKWLFFGGNGRYKIGTFDGKEFTPETPLFQADFGRNFYAAQTWSDVPDSDGRCVMIAWMANNDLRRYPGSSNEQQMSFPTEILLKTTPDGIKMFRLPVREITALYDKNMELTEQTVPTDGTNPLADLNGELYDMTFNFDVSQAQSLTLNLRGVEVNYNAVTGEFVCRGPCRLDPSGNRVLDELTKITVPSDHGILKLRLLLDRTSMELFVNDGQWVATSNIIPEEQNHSYSLTGVGELKIRSAEIHSLNSALPRP